MAKSIDTESIVAKSIVVELIVAESLVSDSIVAELSKTGAFTELLCSQSM